MVSETLNELVTVSDELAVAIDKPAATPFALPKRHDLHPDLAAVLTGGALALGEQGVELGRIKEFTDNAKSRGLRLKVVVFGWHPGGHTWYATPLSHDPQAKVIVIDRLNRLSATELTVEAFLQRSIDAAREAIEEANREPEPEPEPVISEETGEPVPVVEKPKFRVVKVKLPESAGAKIVAGSRTEELDGETFAYIIWCMRGLEMISEEPAPDLDRWVARALRSCRLDAVPKKGADLKRYIEKFNALSKRDRAAKAPKAHLTPSWKLTAPGDWILAPNELAVLRRADKATPRRHVPTAAQTATWALWMELIASDEVLLHVH